MFSGIIDAIGTIRESRETPGGRLLRVDCPRYWQGLPLGASVAIDGVCLTLTHQTVETGEFDVIAETLRRTTLGDLRAGDRVNLQKSLAVGDRIDGHFVQGHVDAVAVVARVEQTPAESIWRFSLGADTMAYMIPKGSVAIDGISLTIADVSADGFAVALIPATLERTTLGQKRAGARVNIETDILTRTVVQYLRRSGVGTPPAGGLTREQLLNKGFI